VNGGGATCAVIAAELLLIAVELDDAGTTAASRARFEVGFTWDSAPYLRRILGILQNLRSTLFQARAPRRVELLSFFYSFEFELWAFCKYS
jgi:hypothetical protein